MSKREAWKWWVITILFISLLVVAATRPRAHETADHWLNKTTYKDPVTLELCCYHKHSNPSFNHCKETDYIPKRNNDGSYTLQTGEVVPKARVQWSRDWNYYECRDDSGKLLCFFAVPDGL